MTQPTDERSDSPADRSAPRSIRPDRPAAPRPMPDLPKTRSARQRNPQPQPWFARLAVRRTIIPVLLTLSVLLPVVAVAGVLSRTESPLHLNLWWAVILVTMSVCCATLAGLNMLAVRRELASAKPDATPR